MGKRNQMQTDLGQMETRANGVKGERILGRTYTHSVMTVFIAFVEI